jgi:hypothetical protein
VKHDEKPTVAIFGGGIAGLTVAHELVKRGFAVHVYERNPIIGGMARTKSVGLSGGREDFRLPVEMGWRGYGAAYHNLFEILKEIPTRENGRSVFNNLKRLRCVSPANDDTVDTVNAIMSLTGHTLTHRERLLIINEILRALTSCTERAEHRDDEESWVARVYRRRGGISDKAYKYVVHSLGPYLGYTSEKCNVSAVTAFAQHMLQVWPRMEFYQANAPTSEAWFDHWLPDLKRRGVRFSLNTRAVELLTGENGERRVAGALVTDGEKTWRVEADYYVCALSIEAAAELVQSSSPHLVEHDPVLGNLRLLAERGHQIMLAVQYFLDRKVQLNHPEAVHGVYLPDSPWAIMIQLQSDAWDGRVDLPARSRSQVRDVWSVGICVTDRPGLRIKKAFVDCTREEVEEEAWAQIMACEGLKASARVEGGGSLQDVKVVGFYMWDSFTLKDGKIQTWEPRWTNNVGTLRLRPKAETAFHNLLLAGAYTRTGMEIYCMEGACESGRRAARAIAEDHGGRLEPVGFYAHNRPRPLIFGPLRFLDRILFRLGLPHAGEFCGGPLVLFMLYLGLLTALAALAVLLLRS